MIRFQDVMEDNTHVEDIKEANGWKHVTLVKVTRAYGNYRVHVGEHSFCMKYSYGTKVTTYQKHTTV